MREHRILIVVTRRLEALLLLIHKQKRSVSVSIENSKATCFIFTWTGIAGNWAAGSLDVTMRAVRHTILTIMIRVLVTGDPCTSPFK